MKYTLTILALATLVLSSGCVRRIHRQAASNAIAGTRALAKAAGENDTVKVVAAAVETNIKTAAQNSELPMSEFQPDDILADPKPYADKAVADNEAEKKSGWKFLGSWELWLGAGTLALMVASKYWPVLDPVLKLLMSVRETRRQKEASVAQEGFNRLIDITEGLPRDASIADYKQTVFRKLPSNVNDMVNKRLGN